MIEHSEQKFAYGYIRAGVHMTDAEIEMWTNALTHLASENKLAMKEVLVEYDTSRRPLFRNLVVGLQDLATRMDALLVPTLEHLGRNDESRAASESVITKWGVKVIPARPNT